MNLDSKLTILIGEQATGKSTIARILYYCAVCAYNWAQGELGLGDCTFIAHGVTVRKYLSENCFSYRSIIDEETGLIVAEEIDTVSNIIDQAMSDLIDLEVKYGL